jgi:mono/diheme cytochrome c family protein
MKIFVCTLFSLSILCMAACTYNKEEIIRPPAGICDTTAMTYNGQIAAIFSANCYSCHAGSASSGAGIKLDNYNIAQAYAISGILLKSVKHQSGASAMPKNASKLDACTISKIEAWVNRGAPQN